MTKDINLFEFFRRTASEDPQRICIVHKKNEGFVKITYGRLLREVFALRRILQERGLRAGERAAVLLSNGPSWPVSFFAIASLQAAAVPLDCQLPAEKVKELLSHSGSRLLLTEEKFGVSLSDILKEGSKTEVVFLDRIAADISRIADAIPEGGEETAAFSSKEPAAIFYTSGTTQEIKGVVLTHLNLLSNVESIHRLGLIKESDVIISILPLHHTYPFTVTCLIPLFEKARICYSQSLVPNELFNTIRENSVTILVGVPQLLGLIERSVSEKMKKHGGFLDFTVRSALDICVGLSKISKRRIICPLLRDFHRLLGGRLRMMVSGGAKLSPATAKGLVRLGFEVIEGYGLTETSPIVTINNNRTDKFHTVGRTVPGVEVRIAQPDENGRGEIAVKGKNVMAGYDGSPELTGSAIRDGWFYTGDLGRLDRDGYLIVEGRKNEIVVLSSGKKVNPEEVEEAYLKSPYIKEIAVFLPKDPAAPDAGHLSAIIVPDEERLHREKFVDINFKIRWELDSARLLPHQRIRGFVISSQPLPRTRLGKLARYKIEGVYRSIVSHQGEKKKEAQVSEFESKALKYMSRILKKEVRLDDHLELDLGLDSLGRIELLSSLQDLINTGIDDSLAFDMFQARTVRELLEKARLALPEGAFSDLLKKDDIVFWSEVLSQVPKDETRSKLKLDYNFIETAASFVVFIFFRALFFLLFAVTSRGRRNIPQKGPFIIVPNHVSYLDAFFLLSAFPFRLVQQTYFVGFGQIFRHPAIAWAIRFFRLVPLDIDVDLAETLRACRYLLSQGKVLVYFAEGQRSGDGELKEFRKGIGILVRESKTGVLPVYLRGAYKAWPRTRSFPLPAKVTVEIGPFASAIELTEGIAHEDYSSVAGKIRSRVEALKK